MKAERQKVKSMINSHNVAHPVVMVHVMCKLVCPFLIVLYLSRGFRICAKSTKQEQAGHAAPVASNLKRMKTKSKWLLSLCL